MRVAVTLESHFFRTPDKKIWNGGTFDYNFWKRYLDVFDDVLIIARVQDIDFPIEGFRQTDGPNVSVNSVPYYRGPLQFISKALNVMQNVKNTINHNDAIIMRAGSLLATLLESRIRKEGRPYGVEVLGDPIDVFSPGAMRHPLRSFFRWWSPRNLRRQCKNAIATAYVTEKTLQKRYPPSFGAFSTYYSSVELPEESIVQVPRVHVKSGHHKIIMVGTLAQLYKAPNILIEALGICVRNGMQLNLSFVGDGKYKQELQAKASSLGLNKNVEFLGYLNAGQAVRNQLDKSDLFILPSYQEGLPRAMLEAMARGLPCIGSTAGGIPELLSEEDMVPPGNPHALAAKIREVLSNPQRMNLMSQKNLEKAREYENNLLRKRRQTFYSEVKNKTLDWLESRAGHMGSLVG